MAVHAGPGLQTAIWAENQFSCSLSLCHTTYSTTNQLLFFGITNLQKYLVTSPFAKGDVKPSCMKNKLFYNFQVII